MVVRGDVPWPALGAALAGLAPVSSGRWAVEDIALSSLLELPSWGGVQGFAGEQAALAAARGLLHRKPALLIIAPGFRAARSAVDRTVAWPSGRPGMRPGRRAALHAVDLCWAAVAGLLDAMAEVAADELPVPEFVLALPEAFSSAGGRARWEPWYEAHLEALAALPGFHTGSLYQCAWAPHEAAAEPLRILSSLPAVVEDCFAGPPIRQAARGPDGGRRFAYRGPLPSSCGCGSAHRRRPAEEAVVAEPMEAGASRQLATRLEEYLNRHAARPEALFGGEVAALALLSGPPTRGPAVSAALAGKHAGWRPLDLYIGRNDRFGDPFWGNPFKVGRDGDAGRCCRRYEDWLRADAARRERFEDLRGRRLRCHCASGTPCHADTLVALFCSKTVGVVKAAGQPPSGLDN